MSACDPRECMLHQFEPWSLLKFSIIIIFFLCISIPTGQHWIQRWRPREALPSCSKVMRCPKPRLCYRWDFLHLLNFSWVSDVKFTAYCASISTDRHWIQRRGPREALRVLQRSRVAPATPLLLRGLRCGAGPLVRRRAGLGDQGCRPLHLARTQSCHRTGR